MKDEGLNVNLTTNNTLNKKNVPEAKSAHKLLRINNDYIILIGGANSAQYYLCNAWIYGIKSRLWRKI